MISTTNSESGSSLPMANLVRSAKSGGDWTLNDLDSYHISLNQVDPFLFFGLHVGEDGSL